MSKKYKEWVKVRSQEQLSEGIYSMWIQCPHMAKEATPGQFISVYTNDTGKLLPRPISICEINKSEGSLRIVYRVTGENTGTELFSKLQEGNDIEVMGPLGNGFPVSGVDEDRKAILIGGGIGIPPMLELAKQLTCNSQIVAGYRDQLFLVEDLEKEGELYIATDDGSTGTKGTVIDAIEEHQLEADIIFACGPTPMLRAIKAYAMDKQIECYISMEEKMACGIGACLACVCKTKGIDAHSNTNNTRVCKDGPVFLATEVDL